VQKDRSQVTGPGDPLKRALNKEKERKRGAKAVQAATAIRDGESHDWRLASY